MTNDEIIKLVDKYFYGDKHEWPSWMGIGQGGGGEVRYDYDSSMIAYSLVRHYKPTSVLEFGASYGHSVIFNTDALLKNGKPFTYVAFEFVEDIYNAAKANLERRHGKLIPQLYFGDIREQLDKIPKTLDYVFIDGNHDLDTTQWYVDNIFPRIKRGSLVAIHDFAVTDKDGKWMGKDQDGKGGLPETQLLMDLHEAGKLPLKKLFWTYGNPLWAGMSPNWEGSFWEKV